MHITDGQPASYRGQEADSPSADFPITIIEFFFSLPQQFRPAPPYAGLIAYPDPYQRMRRIDSADTTETTVISIATGNTQK